MPSRGKASQHRRGIDAQCFFFFFLLIIQTNSNKHFSAAVLGFVDRVLNRIAGVALSVNPPPPSTSSRIFFRENFCFNLNGTLFPESTGGRKHSRTVGEKSGTSNGENGILLGFRSVCGTELAMPDLEIPENGFVLMETGGSFRALKSTPPSLLMRENPYPCEKKKSIIRQPNLYARARILLV